MTYEKLHEKNLQYGKLLKYCCNNSSFLNILNTYFKSMLAFPLFSYVKVCILA